MSVLITSDLHLGHPSIAKHRGFDSVEEHDECVMENLHAAVSKRGKLFILGDIAWNKQALALLKSLPCQLDAVLGNHDLLKGNPYAEVFTNVCGLVRYKKFWLSHCPIHPQEMYRCNGNIHGHIHKNTESPELPLPYLNVNLEFHNMKPVAMDQIISEFKEAGYYE